MRFPSPLLPLAFFLLSGLTFQSKASASPKLERSSAALQKKQQELFSQAPKELFLGRIMSAEIASFKRALEEAKSQQHSVLESMALRAESAIKTITDLAVRDELFGIGGGVGAGGSAAGSGGASFHKSPDLPTMLIGGALDFVRKRAKEEALRFILEKMDKELCVKDGGEELLPSFCTLLGQIHNSRWVAPLSLLLPALRQDLAVLPQSILKNLSATDSPALHCGLGITVQVHREISSLPSLQGLTGSLTRSLYNPNCMPYFFGQEIESDWSTYAQKISIVRVAFAAVLRTIDNNGISSDRALFVEAEASLRDLLPTSEGHDLAILEFMEDYESRLLALESLQAPSKPADKRRFEKAWVELKAIQSEIDQFLELQRGVAEKLQEKLLSALQEKLGASLLRLSKRLYLLNTRLEQLARVRSKDDTTKVDAELRSVLDESLSLLEALLVDTASSDTMTLVQEMRSLLKAMEALRHNHFAPGISLLLATGLFESNTAVKTLLPFLELLAGLADAKNSEDVSELIENAALPTGSWREKRRKFTLGLAAQFGVSGGLERTSANNSPHLGAYIPVGVDVSWPIGKTWAGGFLLQIVDLGTVTSTRLGEEDEVAREPRYELSTIFAPGVQGYLGIGNSPFVIGLGVDIVPTLRATSDGSTSAALRGRLSLAIDLPLYMF
ncbi:MAG: hypothetical protein JKY56_13875 [Kofleriaceae bacterium]|nr:hypothetical protein [Kofleriaceae bacterium]